MPREPAWLEVRTAAAPRSSKREAGSWPARIWLLRLAACRGVAPFPGHIRIPWVGYLHVLWRMAGMRMMWCCVCYCRTRSADVDPEHLAPFMCSPFCDCGAWEAGLGGIEVWFLPRSSEILLRCGAHPTSEDGTRDWLVAGVEGIHDAFHPRFVDLFTPRREISASGIRAAHWTW